MVLPGDVLPRVLCFWAMLLDTVLTADVPVAGRDFSRAAGSNLLRAVAVPAARSKPAPFYRQATETFPQSLQHIRNVSLEFSSFSPSGQ